MEGYRRPVIPVCMFVMYSICIHTHTYAQHNIEVHHKHGLWHIYKKKSPCEKLTHTSLSSQPYIYRYIRYIYRYIQYIPSEPRLCHGRFLNLIERDGTGITTAPRIFADKRPMPVFTQTHSPLQFSLLVTAFIFIFLDTFQ